MKSMSNEKFNQESNSFLKDENEVHEKEDTKCGYGVFKGKWLNKFADQNSFLFVYSITGMLTGAFFTYYSGTTSTIEKHFKFSSTQIGFIGAFYQLFSTFVSLIVPYFCAKGRIPKWLGLSVLCYGIAGVMYSLPYFVVGPNDDILSMTVEYGDGSSLNRTSEDLFNNELCHNSTLADECTEKTGSSGLFGAAVLFSFASAVAGFGGAIYGILGSVYIDNNCKKSEAPMRLTLSSFIQFLAPALGYGLASVCLKVFVVPSLHPTVSNTDPQWIGAWWIGFLVFGILMFLLAPVISMFPKSFKKTKSFELEKPEDEKTKSVKDLLQTFKRLIQNKTYFFNSMAGIFYCFGYVPFFFFQVKYIEVNFLFSASTASILTGVVSLVFAAIGMLVSGIIVTIFKPKARSLALWNIASGLISTLCILSYGSFSCTADSNSLMMQNSQINATCNLDCHCEFVTYNPVCGENDAMYISPCHAGCTDEVTFSNGSKVFQNCQCIRSVENPEAPGSAKPGTCSLDCLKFFIPFFILLCINQFNGGTDGTINFLLGLRCVEKRDKATSIGVTTASVSLLAIVPSVILFGWIWDSSCMVWGETCEGKGNCLLYNTDKMRYTFNVTSAFFILLGTTWDIGTWYYSKTVQMFDEEETNETELKSLSQ